MCLWTKAELIQVADWQILPMSKKEIIPLENNHNYCLRQTVRVQQTDPLLLILPLEHFSAHVKHSSNVTVFVFRQDQNRNVRLLYNLRFTPWRQAGKDSETQHCSLYLSWVCSDVPPLPHVITLHASCDWMSMSNSSNVSLQCFLLWLLCDFMWFLRMRAEHIRTIIKSTWHEQMCFPSREMKWKIFDLKVRKHSHQTSWTDLRAEQWVGFWCISSVSSHPGWRKLPENGFMCTEKMQRGAPTRFFPFTEQVHLSNY